MVSKAAREALAAFVAERDWAQFHTPENLAKSVSIEAAELLECFQWGAEADPNRVREELADVLTYCLLLADRIGADPEKIVLEKLETTKKKYPVDKARGSSVKYALKQWSTDNERYINWPIVYILDDGLDNASSRQKGLSDIYVGESLNVLARICQHLENPEKNHLKRIRLLIHDKFNKSACLDFESYLIRILAGDGTYRVLNRNGGIVESNYYRRDTYRKAFRAIVDLLAREGIFSRNIREIENSDLFKLSPFKALTEDQAESAFDIVKGFLKDIELDTRHPAVINGEPGTGKTVVAIFIIKLIIDIQMSASLDDINRDSRFSLFFNEHNQRLLRNRRIGLVVPQMSLRDTVKKVFRRTPGLNPAMVLTPFDVAQSTDSYDLLLVDEAHRLNQRASQPSAALNVKFLEITSNLFGHDDTSKTQLDWVKAKSRHQIFLIDKAQTVRPADLPLATLEALIAEARASDRYFRLATQMRVQAGSDYVAYIHEVCGVGQFVRHPVKREFCEYDFRLFSNVAAMRDEILRRDAEIGLSRMVAGYAWEWKTKKDKNAFDIVIGETRLRWNSTPRDWISSAKSLEEVGSVHVVQGYDLNYVGVIIGPDLGFHNEAGFFIRRHCYHDRRGKANNPVLKIKYSDQDLLRFITQIYAVLMTRGMRGTYVYACDPGLRERLKIYIPSSQST